MFKKVIFCFVFVYVLQQQMLYAQHIVDSIYTAAYNNNVHKNKLRSLELAYCNARVWGLLQDSASKVTYLTKCITVAKEAGNTEYESLFNSRLANIFGGLGNVTLAKTHLNSSFTLAKTNLALGTAWYVYGILCDLNVIGVRDSIPICYLRAAEYLKNETQATFQLNLYDELAGYYTYQQLFDKQFLYANKAVSYLSMGADLNTFDSILAYGIKANAYLSKSKYDTNRNIYVDSALLTYKFAIGLAKKQSNIYNPYNSIGTIYHNIATIFYENPDRFTDDSVLVYLDAADNIRTLSKVKSHSEVAALGLLLKADILYSLKRITEAKVLVKRAEETYPEIINDPYSGSKFYYLKSLIAAEDSDFRNALYYLQQSANLNDSTYNLEKLQVTQQIETQFKNTLQAQELKQEKENGVLQQRLNYIYVIIVCLAILAFVYLLRTGRLTRKTMLQQQQLLVEGRNTALLQAKVNEDEAMEAMMEKDIAVQERIIAEQEKLLSQQQRDSLQQVLKVNTLQVERKNELIKDLQEKIKQINVTKEAQHVKMVQAIDRGVGNDEELDYMQQVLSNTNPKFFQLLLAKSNQTLTNLDMKYCAYIKIGMSNREIAQIMNVEQKSVRMAKYRLKQKLNVPKEIDLDTIIIKLSEESGH
jgi:DNA-binding CsgD family transcriptional regulator/tetratricopeptide (TPR) repeat protein